MGARLLSRVGEDGETVAVSGRLTPSYVMLLPDGTDMEAPMEELLANSTWKQLMTVNQRQRLLRLPTNTTGRYVRVQLLSSDPLDYLSLAEVQVYRAEAFSFCNYRGGSPIPKGRYYGTESLLEGFLCVLCCLVVVCSGGGADIVMVCGW